MLVNFAPQTRHNPRVLTESLHSNSDSLLSSPHPRLVRRINDRTGQIRRPQLSRTLREREINKPPRRINDNSHITTRRNSTTPHRINIRLKPLSTLSNTLSRRDLLPHPRESLIRRRIPRKQAHPTNLRQPPRTPQQRLTA
ncbi:MAG: hypothetical protein QM568_14205 [Microbacterium sp.]